MLAQRIIPRAWRRKTMPPLGHDSSTNALIRRYRRLRMRAVVARRRAQAATRRVERRDSIHEIFRQGATHATRNDRPGPDGSQHGAPADRRRTLLRRLRHGPRRRCRISSGTRRRVPLRSPISPAKLDAPRAVWLMVPAAVVDKTLAALLPHLAAGDIVIDGGNSHYVDDIRRAKELAAKGIHYVDVGTSGGVWGLERGYCMMIGGEEPIVRHLDPIFARLAPGIGDIARTPGRGAAGGTAEQGYLHCGPNGAGHFVKMVHNGIEYGLMAAYAEGMNVLRGANIGSAQHAVDAETTPLANPEHYRYDFHLPDIAEVWRRGSVIASWLLDLTANALSKDPTLANFSGRVSDSGEGRWTIKAAIDEARADAGADDGALRALFLARRSRIPGQAAVGDALRVRRSRRKTGGEIDTGEPAKRDDDERRPNRCTGVLRSDRRSRVQEDLPGARRDAEARTAHAVPIICVAKSGWSLEQLIARARESVERHGAFDAASFDRLAGLLRYVDGDYNDAATFRRIKQALGAAQRPGALSRDTAGAFRDRHRAARRVELHRRCARHRREAVRTRPCLGAQPQRHPAPLVRRAPHLSHRSLSRQAAGAQHGLLPVRERVSRGVLEPQVRQERADHDGREFRHPGSRRVLRPGRHGARRDPESPLPGARESRDGAAGAQRQRIDARREGEGAEVDSADRREGPRPRPVRRLSQGARRRAGFAPRDVRGAEARDRLVALGRAFRSTSARASRCR